MDIQENNKEEQKKRVESYAEKFYELLKKTREEEDNADDEL